MNLDPQVIMSYTFTQQDTNIRRSARHKNKVIAQCILHDNRRNDATNIINRSIVTDKLKNEDFTSQRRSALESGSNQQRPASVSWSTFGQTRVFLIVSIFLEGPSRKYRYPKPAPQSRTTLKAAIGNLSEKVTTTPSTPLSWRTAFYTIQKCLNVSLWKLC